MSEAIDLGNIGAEDRHERADAAANRRLLLDTADALFARDGVANVTMADIADSAGVGKGTLYRRFNNKAELCLALIDTQMQEFQDGMLARLRNRTADGVPYLEQLDEFLDALVHFTENHMPVLCEVQRAGLLQAEFHSDLQMPHFWQHMTVHGLLRTAVVAQELSAALDIEYLADALLAPLSADLFRFQREVRGYSLERISLGLRSIVAGLPHAAT